MTPMEILREFYDPGSRLFHILVTHSRMVSEKAIQAAAHVSHLKPDLEFIREAAMLHDIGIFQTQAPGIGCHGPHPYILHGYLGGEILNKKGLPRHALVCERHPGAGISKEIIVAHGLDLPARDMRPQSIEEKIICYADKFYSKTPESLHVEKRVPDIIRMLSSYGEEQAQTFQSWLILFGEKTDG